MISNGRVAWVTGGATGMGRAIALALAKAGANVAIGSLAEGGRIPNSAYAALPSLSSIEQTVEAIRSEGVLGLEPLSMSATTKSIERVS